MNDIAFPKPSMTAKDIFKDQIGATKNDEVTTFSLKAQMLDQGRTDTVLAPYPCGLDPASAPSG